MKKILVIATGSVAVEKTKQVVKQLTKIFQVRVIVSDYVANNFNEVDNLNYEKEEKNLQTFPKHIEISKWADLIVVVPASANTISKFRSGIADNFVLSALLAARNKVIFAPAMNTFMYKAIKERHIIEDLENMGHMFIGPIFGKLREGEVGIGRMEEPKIIVQKIVNYLHPNNKKILLPYGASQVKIDDVRFISNRSSGKMGKLLANELRLQGFQVDAINISSITNKNFIALAKQLDYDIYISPAAFADFDVNQKVGKICKGTINQISLLNNIDVITELKKMKPNPQYFGFKLDSNKKNAFNKMKELNLDGIIWNKICALNSDKASGSIILHDKEIPFKNIQKKKLAQMIASIIKC